MAPRLPRMTPGERLLVALAVVVGLALASLEVWAITTGAAPWWVILR